jgi:hypothetical protein
MGPKGINDPKSPGIHGVNNGSDQDPSMLQKGGEVNPPGTVNHGCCGSQGRY